MKNTKVKFLLVFCLVLTFFISLFSLTTKAQAFKRVNKGDKVIPFTLTNINGQKASVNDYLGKSALAIVFWKYPSDRCTEEMDVLQGLQSKYKDKGFEIIAIYSPMAATGMGSDETDQLYGVIADKNYTFQVCIDSDMDIYNKYGVLTFPSLALVSKEGIVFEIMPGFPKFSGKKNLTNSVMTMLGIELPKKDTGFAKYQPDKKAERYYGIAKKMYGSAFYGKAESNLQQAITIDAKYADAFALLGNVYAKKGNVELAEKNFKISLELDTTSAETHFEYGIFCRDRSIGDCAQAEFEKVLTLNPDSGNGHYGLGSMYRLQKKYDEAVSEFEEAIRLFEEGKNGDSKLTLAHSHYELGLIAAELKQEDKSLNKFQQANILYKNIMQNLVSVVD